MKSVNPKTGKPFKRGDTREDDMVFKGYQKRNHVDGATKYYEMWITPKKFEEESIAAKLASQRKTAQAHENRRKGIKGKRRNNPETNQPFRYGDISRDGLKLFNSYSDYEIKTDGYCVERWYSISAFKKTKKQQKERRSKNEHFLHYRVNIALGKARIRAKQKKVPFDLNLQYLKGIFPADNLCPVFGVTLEWGGGSDEVSRDNSPSLDRIIPELGYVEGNVVWISNRANILKRDAVWEELQRVAEWLKSVTPE